MDDQQSQLVDEITALVDDSGFYPDVWQIRDFVLSLVTHEEMRQAEAENRLDREREDYA